MPHKHFDCPHCGAPVPAEWEALDAASAVLVCTGCGRQVYLAMGRLSNFQPGQIPGEAVPEGYAPAYDSGD